MNITRLSKDHYRVREMYHGKTYSKYYPYKPTRREAQTDINTLIDNENNTKNEKFEYCINVYINSKLNILSPSSIRRYKLFIKTLPDKILNTYIDDIDNIKLQSLINDYSKTHSPKTTKDFYGFIKSILSIYTDKRYRVILPQIIKKESYIPNKEDVKRIIEYSKNTIYEIPILLASYGIRVGEILALTLKDIKDGEITINKTVALNEYNEVIKKAPKTASSIRKIKIPLFITNKIKQKKEIYKGSATAINRFLYKAEKHLDIPQFSIHKLRHFFASELHLRNIPSKYIQAMGGWATDNVMKTIYIHTTKPLETINIFD